MNTVLTLDGTSVAASEGVTFHLNQAIKHPENPVLLPGEPHEWDSLQVSWPGTVLYSEKDRKFRCWYAGLDVIQTKGRFWRPGYAESDDGVHWIKPKLGEVTFLDRPGNQLKHEWNQIDPRAVFVNPLPDAPPSQRFGAYWMEHNWDPSRGETYLRLRLAWSPDGIHWDMKGIAYGTQPVDRPAYQDLYSILYDLKESDPAYRIKGYTQIMRPRGWGGGPELVRHIGLVHGSSFVDLQNASQPVLLAPVEGIDEELHFASVKKIGGTYLMLFESDRFSRNPIHGDLKLAVSNDGRAFRRVHNHTPLVPTGPKGSWDENLLVNTGSTIQEVGDELYIFYFGCPNTYNSWPAEYAVTHERRGSMFAPAYLGLATLPRDRFAFACGPGKLITHTIHLSAGDVWLNCDGEDVRLRAGNANGRLTTERRETVYRKVQWTPAVPQGDISIQIELAEGVKVYSLAWD